MKVSVLIINYNYAQYLTDAIESCLNQTYKNIEIIVVDDGSTDHSNKIIDKYKGRITALYQENAGMTEAVNNGFRHSSGEVIIILDADDYLFETAIEEVAGNWKPGISKLHFRLQKVDEKGNKIGVFPAKKKEISSGDVWKEIVETGFYITPPTSGNAFSRNVFDQIFPIKDAHIGDSESYFDRIPTDAYLKRRVPFYGPVIAIQKPLAAYRIHGANGGATTSPYGSEKKRKRLLYLAKKDNEFIEKKSKEMGFKWDENTLFVKDKSLMLRIINFKIDKNKVYEFDTISSLIKIIFKYGFTLQQNYSSVFKFLFLLILPKSILSFVIHARLRS